VKQRAIKRGMRRVAERYPDYEKVQHVTDYACDIMLPTALYGELCCTHHYYSYSDVSLGSLLAAAEAAVQAGMFAWHCLPVCSKIRATTVQCAAGC
jgi:hypothetical protein